MHFSSLIQKRGSIHREYLGNTFWHSKRCSKQWTLTSKTARANTMTRVTCTIRTNSWVNTWARRISKADTPAVRLRSRRPSFFSITNDRVVRPVAMKNVMLEKKTKLNINEKIDKTLFLLEKMTKHYIAEKKCKLYITEQIDKTLYPWKNRQNSIPLKK